MIRSSGLPLPGAAPRLAASDPSEPVRRADAGALPSLGGSGRRGRRRRQDDARVSRVVAREPEHRPDAGPLDRRLRRPRQLHVHALPLGQRRGPRVLLLARDRSAPRRRRAPRPGRTRGRGCLPQVRARVARSLDRRAALPRRGLPDRGPAGAGPAASQHGAARQLCGARKGGGAEGRIEADSRSRAEDVCRCRSRALFGNIDPAICETQEQSDVAPMSLRDAHAGARRHPDRPLARLRGADGGGRQTIPFSPSPGRSVSRRAPADGARRALLLGAAPSRRRPSTDGSCRPIRGAKQMFDGKATDLEGFHIVSPDEFVVDLEQPVAFFPAVHFVLARRRSCRREPGRSVPEAARASSERDPSGSSASSPAGVSSSNEIRTTGATGFPRATAWTFASASLPTKSGASSWPADSRSPRTCCPPTPRPSGTILGSPARYRESPRRPTYFVTFNSRQGTASGSRNGAGN